jgi:hypothetical protein
MGVKLGFLTLREGRKLNKLLRRTFGRKRDVVIGGWRMRAVMVNFIIVPLGSNERGCD